MSRNDIPFDIPEGSIALDINGNEFHLGSVGPAFVYPIAKTLKQAQHLHSLWLHQYETRNNRTRYNDSDRLRAAEDYQRAREIIALANRIET